LIWGPENVSTIAAELDAIERELPGPYLAATVEIGRSEVARLEQRFDDARGLAERAYDGFLALGMRPIAAGCAQALARIELSAGDAETARAILERCDAVLAEFGERPQRSTIQAMLARVHELLGERDGARAALLLAERLSAAEDAINYAITHDVRARLALADGDGEAAGRWARSAVDYALLTDFVGLHAESRLGLAGVASRTGDRAEAAGEARAALELFLTKGDQPGSESARALLEELGELS
jgi:tetratricopeptide (TPR) repeat protein